MDGINTLAAWIWGCSPEIYKLCPPHPTVMVKHWHLVCLYSDTWYKEAWMWNNVIKGVICSNRNHVLCNRKRNRPEPKHIHDLLPLPPSPLLFPMAGYRLKTLFTRPNVSSLETERTILGFGHPSFHTFWEICFCCLYHLACDVFFFQQPCFLWDVLNGP